MAITYHAGRRIQGLSTDFSADILNEDFDYVSQTAANNVWVPQNNTGNKRVNISTDKFEHSFGGGGSTTNSNCVYDLGAGNVSNTKWVLDFTAVVASVHRPNNVNNSSNFGLFTEDGTAANGSGTGGKGVCLGFGNQSADTKFWAITRTDSTGTDGFNRIGTQFSTNDSTGTYFIRMVRDNNNVTVSIHTAASRTSANLTEEETVSVTGMTGLRWLGSKNYIINVSSNNFSFNIDDVVFYNDVTNITDPVYPSNAQLGSRIEETDTRKMYYSGTPDRETASAVTKISLTGLTAYYTFEQTSGTMTNQASTIGSSNQITADGTFETFGTQSSNRSATGHIGTYATFFSGNSSGNGGSRYNLSGAPMSGTGDFSFSWWEKGIVSGNTNTVIGTYPSSNWQISTGSSGLGFWTNTGSGSANTAWSPSGAGDNNWKHYVVTRTSGNLALWYNGSVQTITGGQALRNGSFSGNPSIGSDPASGSNREAHGGTIDDMSIWNRALTTSEISTLYSSGYGRELPAGNAWKELGT
jgi:hypothetical protein